MVSAKHAQLEVDDDLTSDEYTTYFNPQNGTAYVAFRGTQGPEDLMPDVHIAFDSRAHQRFVRAEEIVKRANAKYNNNVKLTGHSLGGTLALHASQYSGNTAVVFNPGGSAQHKGANARVVRNENDFVSLKYANVADNVSRQRTPAETLADLVFGGARLASQQLDHGLEQFL